MPAEAPDARRARDASGDARRVRAGRRALPPRSGVRLRRTPERRRASLRALRLGDDACTLADAGARGAGRARICGRRMSLTVLSVAYPLAPVSQDAVGGAEQMLSHLDHALVRAGHRSIVVASGVS